MTMPRDTSHHLPAATNKNAESLVQSAIQRDHAQREFQTAIGKMTRSLKCRPGGRRKWMFDHTAHGTYRPAKPLLEMIDLAIDAGAPQQDVQAIATALALYITGRYAIKNSLPCVKTALVMEANDGANADKAQTVAAVDPSPSNIERAIEATVAHQKSAETLIHACFRHLHLTSPRTPNHLRSWT